VTRRAVVIVTSTRAAAGEYEDRTGPMIAAWLAEHAFSVDPVVVVADGPEVAAALAAAVASAPSLVVTTGGTGVGLGDGTPDATSALLDKALPGFSEELRRRGAASSPLSLLSRGVAGIAGSTFVVNFPGSTGGVRDGLQLLGEVVEHLLDQLAGRDHGHSLDHLGGGDHRHSLDQLGGGDHG
jgi:molybdenum cofactor synthesis domain-containing protein